MSMFAWILLTISRILPDPALQPSVASVLIRFRMHRIGMIAEVEQLARKDLDLHRYRWRDLKTDEAPKVYRMLRLTFGVNPSLFLAIVTVPAHLHTYAETFPTTAREFLHTMYVDQR